MINFDHISWFFHSFLITFGENVSFFDPPWSPSISAPLVVKKCPKLYIYNIGMPGHCVSHTTVGRHRKNVTQQNAPKKCQKSTPIKTSKIPVHKGENESIFFSQISPVNLPDCNKQSATKNLKNKQTEGRTRVLIYNYPVNLPDILNKI